MTSTIDERMFFSLPGRTVFAVLAVVSLLLKFNLLGNQCGLCYCYYRWKRAVSRKKVWTR